MAPELFEDPPRYGYASDLYALGMTLASRFLDARPYPSGKAEQLLGWVLAGDRPRMTAHRPDMPHELTTLVDRMLARDAGRRPDSASEAFAALGMVASRRRPPREVRPRSRSSGGPGCSVPRLPPRRIGMLTP